MASYDHSCMMGETKSNARSIINKSHVSPARTATQFHALQRHLWNVNLCLARHFSSVVQAYPLAAVP